MKIYAVVCCYERDIYTVGKAKTLGEAHKIMKKDFLDFCSDYLDYDEMEEIRELIITGEIDSADKGCCIMYLSAWSSLGGENCNWRILSFEMEDEADTYKIVDMLERSDL